MTAPSKTLDLMYFFSPNKSEIGLSQLCQLAAWDKATTYRRVQSLVETGFIEQNATTKRYRLGPAVLQLAQTRESTVPRKAGAKGPLLELANATGETSRVSVISGNTLYQLVTVESPTHSIQATVDTQTRPLHTSSSGLCALAFGSADLVDMAQADLFIYTPATTPSARALHTAIRTTQSSGVSVACVGTRFTPDLEQIAKTQLIKASREITHNWGGSIPLHIDKVWAPLLANRH